MTTTTPETQPQTEIKTGSTATRRLPRWTVLANLKRLERTPWIGRSIEFFDDEREANKCYNRHQRNGDTPTKRPFHHSDEQHLHIMDTRAMSSPNGEVHILLQGLPLCLFTTQPPNLWPDGNSWVGMSGKDQATCHSCRERAE